MVKNEEEMLERCLASITHLVDEIIVVDTGSTDRTVEIAESFGAKIFHHPWEQDFSKHRNQSISYATGDWFLIIDADEEMDARHLTKKELKKNIKKISPKVHCLLMRVLDKNRQGNISSVTQSARIFKNRVGVEYRGIVHNTAHYTGKATDSDLSLFHYGYALPQEQMQAKFKRTSSLLHKRIENDPDDFTAYFYLCQVYMQMKERHKGIVYANQCLKTLPSIEETDTDISFYHSLFHAIAMAQIELEEYDMAVATARNGLEVLPDEVDLYYDIACAGYFSKNAVQIIEGAENYLRVLEEFKNAPMRSGSRFVFSTSKEIQITVESWLMTAYLTIKDFDRTRELWNSNRNLFIDKPTLQKEFLTNLERAEAWDIIEEVVTFLLRHQKKYPSVTQQFLLGHAIFLNRKNNKDEHLESLITEYLELITDYKEIPTDKIVIIAEFLLKKGMGDFFLDLTVVLFDKLLTNKIGIIKDAADAANGYSLISAQQNQTINGRLIATICLNIAWDLTEDKQYLADSDKARGPYEQTDSAIKKTTVSPHVESQYNEPEGFRAAFKEIDITPILSTENPVQLQGMSEKKRPAYSVSSPLKLQMLLIEDEKQTKLFFVTADILGFDNKIANKIKKAGEMWGIVPEGVILNASNTQYAPGTISHIHPCFGPYDKKFSEKIETIIINQLTMLHGALESSSLYVGNTVTGINANKKTGATASDLKNKQEYDTHTPFLFIDIDKGSKRVLLINPGSLSTMVDTKHSLSAGFPGYCRSKLIDKGRIEHVMYLQGTTGGTTDISQRNKGVVSSKTKLEPQETGDLLAESICKALDSEMTPLTEPLIAYSQKTMYLPLKNFPDINNIKRLYNDPDTSPCMKEWASRLAASYPTGDFPNTFMMDVQTASIGKKATFICFPATPVTAWGKKLKGMTDSPEHAFLLGNTNGLGYLPDEETIGQQDHEQETYPYFHMMPYFFGKGIEKEIITKTQQCLNEINDPAHAFTSKKSEEKATTNMDQDKSTQAPR